MAENEKLVVREIENTWIKLSDGCCLAARIWMPENAETKPVPAILEYLPYRKRDGTTIRDALTHPYVAAAGYVCIRVDMRGNGDSDGLMEDEYTRQEQDDALEVIDWISNQPWCSGNVGMIGISWGGFNGLQVAARQPKALKAVISMCSTDDRYADDIHYMGGTLLNYNLGWAAVMLAYSSRPPDPVIVGDEWRDIWMNRLENLPFLIKPWLEHQHRDDYWKHGSICEDYTAVKVPVFLVGGWADGYSNTVFRMLKGLKCPVTALVGPWGHLYPNFGKPEPAIGFLQECIRFWDHWLKDQKNSIMDEPVRTYIQDSVPPKAMYDHMPGTWETHSAWPPPNVSSRSLYPCEGGLCDTPGKDLIDIQTPQTLGKTGGRWFSFGVKPDLPTDQSPDDKDAVVFETEPLEDDVVICGAPVLKIRLSSDQPFGILCARVSDVRPDGSITRMSYGLINLTHHASHETPEPLVPGKFYTVRLQLNETTWCLPKGHGLRLSLSNTYWPMIWPSPGKTTLTLDESQTCLELPVQDHASPLSHPFLEPENGPALEQAWIRPSSGAWTVEEDMETGSLTTHILDDYGDRIISKLGLRTSLKGTEAWKISPDDPLSATADIYFETLTGRADWQITTQVSTRMKADETHFHITANVIALENGKQIFHKSYNHAIKRNLV